MHFLLISFLSFLHVSCILLFMLFVLSHSLLSHFSFLLPFFTFSRIHYLLMLLIVYTLISLSRGSLSCWRFLLRNICLSFFFYSFPNTLPCINPSFALFSTFCLLIFYHRLCFYLLLLPLLFFHPSATFFILSPSLTFLSLFSSTYFCLLPSSTFLSLFSSTYFYLLPSTLYLPLLFCLLPLLFFLQGFSYSPPH